MTRRDGSGTGVAARTANRPRITPLDAPPDAPVVVGVDASPRSSTAVRLAALEARMHDRELRIVHAFNWIADPGRVPGGEVRTDAEAVTDRATAIAAETAPGLRISSCLDEGPVVTTLLRESNRAALIIVGDGGLLGCTCVPLDRTPVQVAARAGCTVLLSRATPPDSGPVLVGVDGSPGSHCALEYAFDTAARRSRELVVLRATEPDEKPPEGDPTDRIRAETAPWRQRYPGVRVRYAAPAGDPAEMLVAESARAELTVVGSRGDQPWRSMLGAVAQAALHHSPTPVAVVRGAHRIYIQGQEQ